MPSNFRSAKKKHLNLYKVEHRFYLINILYEICVLQVYYAI